MSSARRQIVHGDILSHKLLARDKRSNSEGGGTKKTSSHRKSCLMTLLYQQKRGGYLLQPKPEILLPEPRQEDVRDRGVEGRVC